MARKSVSSQLVFFSAHARFGLFMIDQSQRDPRVNPTHQSSCAWLHQWQQPDNHWPIDPREMRLCFWISNFETHSKESYREYFLWSCPHVNATKPLWWWSQHWFRQWLDVVRQQAITWTSADQVLWRHMASLAIGHNELMTGYVTTMNAQYKTLCICYAIYSLRICETMIFIYLLHKLLTITLRPIKWSL